MSGAVASIGLRPLEKLNPHYLAIECQRYVLILEKHASIHAESAKYEKNPFTRAAMGVCMHFPLQ